MYKEMFEAVVCNVPQGKVVRLYDPDITYVGPYFLFQRFWTRTSSSLISQRGQIAIDFPNVTQIGIGPIGECFDRCGLVSVNLPKLANMYGTWNFAYNECSEISLPLVTSFGNHDFSFSATMKTLNLPSVTSKRDSFFVYSCSALEDVYLPKMKLSDLGGASYIAQQACSSAAVFHLKDGDYDYQGNPISA